jgi:hypothetical protein
MYQHILLSRALLEKKLAPTLEVKLGLRLDERDEGNLVLEVYHRKKKVVTGSMIVG